METLYGEITTQQFNLYKEKLHKKIFWLLLYKDPKTCSSFSHINLDEYFVFLMKEITGLSNILPKQIEIIELLTLLQAALNETHLNNFNYNTYRKLVLDAHGVLDKMEV